MQTKKEQEKQKYVFTDNFTFGFVMRDENICKGLLERIIPEMDFTDIRFDVEPNPLFSEEDLSVDTEKSLKFDPDSKGIRFDAYAKAENLWAEIEMQTYTGEHIGKRSRYYHSNMDMDMLDGGEKYKALKPTYVIFICTYDYMKKGEAVYFFQDYDVKNNLPLDTEAYTIILNTSCNSKLVPERLKSLFAYINDPARIEEPFIQSIDNRVQEFNTTKWRRKQMTLEHIIDNEKEKTELLTRERINRLNKKLIIEKRFDDLERATEDQEFQEQLLQEYNL